MPAKTKLSSLNARSNFSNELAQVNEKWDLDEDRASWKLGRAIAPLRNIAELRQECNNLEEEIENHQKLLKVLYSDIRMAEKRCKGLTMVV